MNEPEELRTWLELDSDGIVHAGEYIRAILHVTCNSPSMELLLATIQLNGVLTISEHHISPGPLAELTTLPGYGASVSALHGGGKLFVIEEEEQDAARTFPIFASPPSVVASAEKLYELVQYSCNHSKLI